ncbi:MAG: hypothetical protein JRE40_13130 [Deltaproteobacteria bacterium]|nr:hypothetical protein [Deltaproteobacteria bacterium]
MLTGLVALALFKRGRRNVAATTVSHALIEEYADAVAIHGVGSSQAQAIRELHAQNTEFLAFANSMDRLKCSPITAKNTPSRRPTKLPEDRARFIAAFLKHAFRERTAISVFCHKDKPFPEIHSGGKVDEIHVSGSGDEWQVILSLNHYVWFVDGHVDIELERDMPMLRVSSEAPCGAKIQLVFIPEGGYGPMDTPPGENRSYYDLWLEARRALDRYEYFEFVGS